MIYLKNDIKQRFHLLYIETDLFNTWRLVRRFGGIKNNLGRVLYEPHDNQEQALNKLAQVKIMKMKNGYTL